MSHHGPEPDSNLKMEHAGIELTSSWERCCCVCWCVEWTTPTPFLLVQFREYSSCCHTIMQHRISFLKCLGMQRCFVAFCDFWPSNQPTTEIRSDHWAVFHTLTLHTWLFGCETWIYQEYLCFIDWLADRFNSCRAIGDSPSLWVTVICCSQYKPFVIDLNI